MSQVPDAKETKFMATKQEDPQSDEDSEDRVLLINTTSKKGGTPITAYIYINEVDVDMEVDTGASVTIMSEQR